MTKPVKFEDERNRFHDALTAGILTLDDEGVASNADKHSTSSVKLAKGIADLLRAKNRSQKTGGQTSGTKFQDICKEFVERTFLGLKHLRPGEWEIKTKGIKLSEYAQYAHLADLAQLAEKNPKLAAALGNDYTINPDIVVARKTVDDKAINIKDNTLVNDNVTKLASLREQHNHNHPLLHASISCKWTIRSDRAQNTRLEALNLIRNRKGRLPHMVVVTAEPLPSRLESIALGTGDIDCVYHFALYELQKTVISKRMKEDAAKLNVMVDGNRLKDISDLPLDLAV
ncbi:MAG: restriction endonuclease [Nitrospinae bacterium]|nr:restriction endonuclease [Nitrospinota bacterium]